MYDTSKESPITIRDCLKEIIIKEKEGYYDFGYVWDYGKSILVRMISSGNRDFIFWQPATEIENLRLDYQEIECATDVSCHSPGPEPTLMSHGVYHKDINAKVIQKGSNYSLVRYVPFWYVSTLTFSVSLSFTMEYYENDINGNVANDVVFSMYWGPSGTFNRDI